MSMPAISFIRAMTELFSFMGCSRARGIRVDAVADAHAVAHGLDMNIARPLPDRLADHLVDQLDDRRRRHRSRSSSQPPQSESWSMLAIVWSMLWRTSFMNVSMKR